MNFSEFGLICHNKQNQIGILCNNYNSKIQLKSNSIQLEVSESDEDTLIRGVVYMPAGELSIEK